MSSRDQEVDTRNLAEWGTEKIWERDKPKEPHTTIQN